MSLNAKPPVVLLYWVYGSAAVFIVLIAVGMLLARGPWFHVCILLCFACFGVAMAAKRYYRQ